MQHSGQGQSGPSSSSSSSSSCSLLRFTVQSTDVIQDARMNVSEENSTTVLWYKERFLGDEEIIEHIVHNPTSTICWTIHRPKRGWYIRIRGPDFPPGVSIPLAPVSPKSPHHADAALSFFSRTNVPSVPKADDFTLQNHASTSTVHSYPPTPPPAPALVIQPPSPTTSSSTSTKGPQNPRLKVPRAPPPSQATEFILTPHSTAPTTQPANSSFFSRALQSLRSHQPSHSNSFTLSRIALAPPLSGAPPPYAVSPAASPDPSTPISPSAASPLSTICPPLLTFHDRTPVLTMHALTGVLEIDQNEERLLGVDTSFWIAVALTYLEFLEERESYLAALSD